MDDDIEEDKSRDSLEKKLKNPLKLYSKIVSDNKLVKYGNKVLKVVDVTNNYNSNLKNTNSHTESTLITTSEYTTSKIVQSYSFVIGSEVGIGVASLGGFTPPACVAGTIVGGVTFITGLEMSDQIKTITNSVATESINAIKSAKNMLPTYMKELIHECITDPVENSLKFAYDISKETIQKITHTISSVLYENYKNLRPEQTIVYCDDKNKTKISVKLDKTIATKIYNYCKFAEKNFYSDTYFRTSGSDFMGTSNFELQYDQFKNNINNFNSQLESREHFETPYELVAFEFTKTRPNSNLITKHNLNSNSIPNYQITAHLSGEGGSSNMNGIVGVVIIMIHVSFAI